MLVTHNKIKLSYLNSNVRFILNTRVTWERRTNERPITQCRRCQRWGHATANCQRTPRCLKCAEEHWTRDCTKPKELPAKCANCKEAHPANYSGCIEYTRRVDLLNEKRERATQQLKPAPIPSTSAWDRRRRHTNTQITSGAVDQNTQQFPMREHFPPLTRRGGGVGMVPAPRRSGATETRHDEDIEVNQGIGLFTDIAQEVKDLNRLVNLKGLLDAFRDLNQLLNVARSSQEKFMTFTQFMSELDKYNI
nr:unnamed protein product [Callosobruchus analis]CAI5847969.1 unnamed protein product [Callosobruchus analis]CAI5848152.1 unnamed protein product [Callosobruchus analis]